LEFAERALNEGAHPDRAHLDSELLLMYLLGKERAWLIAHPRKELSAEQQDRYEALIRRRRSGEPIQYITGETEFYGLPFRVTPDVLIPRPETEHLVERTLFLAQAGTSALKGHDFSRAVEDPETKGALVPDGKSESAPSRARILDIGTGSGAIAISLAHELTTARITAIDLSESALALARQNAERNGVADRIRFLQGDLLAPVAGEQFEFIVSNPPYVPSSDRDTLAVEVRDHEPSLALFAGDDGLDVYRRLIPAALASLVPHGFIALEIGFGQQDPVRDLLANTGFQRIEFHPDLQNIPRVGIAQKL
jgi:release factor glutamine methyltransferase